MNSSSNRIMHSPAAITEPHQNIVLTGGNAASRRHNVCFKLFYSFHLPRGQWVCCWGVVQRRMHETNSGRRHCMWLLPTVPHAAPRPCSPIWATWTWQIAPAELPCITQLRVGSRRWEIVHSLLEVSLINESSSPAILFICLTDGEAAAKQRGQPECHR